jgi:ribosomal protein S12 methylthiotransferase
MYAYPTTFSDEMIDAIASLPSVLKYIDIPLQHASDNMLRAMRRNVTAQHQRTLIEKLRERVPGMAIRTTFITGFPGETEDDHRRLLEFIDDMRFDMLGVFEYSQEEGTVAGTLEADPALAVPPEVKARRKDEIMSLQRDIAFEQAAFLAEQFDPADPLNTGVRFDVLIDEPAPDVDISGGVGKANVYRGRCYFQAPMIDSVTFVASRERLAPGELVRCVIVGSDGYDLVARPITDLERRTPLTVVR